MKTFSMLALAATLLLPAALEAQSRPGRAGGPGGPGAVNPITTILEQRQALSLNSDQIARLEVIRDALEEKNAPTLARMQAARSNRGSGNARSTMQPLMEELRTNAEAASTEAMALLTEEQRRQATTLMENMRPGRGQRNQR